MSTVAGFTGPLTDPSIDRNCIGQLLPSAVCTTIEWYDFLLYSFVAGLVFGEMFFPKSGYRFVICPA